MIMIKTPRAANVVQYLHCDAATEALSSSPDSDTQHLLRLLRANDLLGTVAYRLSAQTLTAFASRHFLSAKRYAERQKRQVICELKALSALLRQHDIEPIFLKGGAYILANDSNHFGRLMSDIDMLVDQADIKRVEQILMEAGWKQKQLDDYDDNYYRRWSHEIPPMYHPQSGATLDVHHTIIPPITGFMVDYSYLKRNAEPSSTEGILVLNLKCRLLHCILHFLFNEDYQKAARDGYDIFCLSRQLAAEDGVDAFYQDMKALGFLREFNMMYSVLPLWYPSSELDAFTSKVRTPNFFIVRLLFLAMTPADCHQRLTPASVAKFLMFLRGHLVKMPLSILFPHALEKSRRWLVKLVMGAHYYDK